MQLAVGTAHISFPICLLKNGCMIYSSLHSLPLECSGGVRSRVGIRVENRTTKRSLELLQPSSVLLWEVKIKEGWKSEHMVLIQGPHQSEPFSPS